MRNDIKTKKQLIQELEAAYQRLSELERAGETLWEREKRFSDIAENALEWIWEVDANGKYTYSSSAVEKILGYKPEEILKKHFYDLFPPEDQEELKKAAFEAFAQKQPFREFINPNVHKNGDTVLLSTSGTPIIDKEGNLLGYRGADTDITGRKKMEKALRESEEFTHSLLENAPNPIVVINPDTSIKYVNPAFEKLTAFTLDEIAGRKAPHPWWPEGEKGKISISIKESMASGGRRVERRFQKKNGELFWIDMNLVPVMYNGVLKYHMANWVDITAYKRAEEIIRESEEFTHSLLENAPNPVFVVNPDTSVRYVNPAFEKLTGFTSAEAVGRKAPHPWWSEERKGEINAKFKTFMKTGTTRIERTIRKKNGEISWTAMSSVPVMSDGTFKYLLVNWVDITERKQAEEKIKQALANMEHYSAQLTATNQRTGSLQLLRLT